MSTRVDNWTSHEDKVLADTILEYVRYGKTQLQAFDDTAELIDRSAAACGYRWNTYLRSEHKEALRLARRERRHQKLDTPKMEIPVHLELVENKKVLTVDDIDIKEFKGHRVVTFKNIDEVHGRPEGTARKNFNQHKNRFIEGEDFFVRNSDEAAKEFGVIAPNGLKLLTESGYLMLVKSFTDDLAWNVQRSLVKSYFRVKQTEQVVSLPTTFAEALRLAADLEEQKQKLEVKTMMLEQQVAEYEPKINYIDTILQSKDTLLVSQIAEDYGLSGKKLNQILHEARVQHKMNGQWLLYSQHKGLGFTESQTYNFLKQNGEEGSKLYTRWTQKGRLFIHTILTNRGITPLMDKNEQEKSPVRQH